MNRGDESSESRDEILARFGIRIAEQRKARGWTQRGLGLHTNVAPTRLSRMERGGVWPKPEELVALRQALGLTLDELVLGEAGPGLEEQEQRLAKLLKELAPVEDWEAVLRLLRVLISGYRNPRGDEGRP